MSARTAQRHAYGRSIGIGLALGIGTGILVGDVPVCLNAGFLVGTCLEALYALRAYRGTKHDYRQQEAYFAHPFRF